MSNPNKDEANYQTGANLATATEEQLKRIFTLINSAISKKEYSIIFYEDLIQDNRTTLQAEGYKCYQMGGKDDEAYYQISWK